VKKIKKMLVPLGGIFLTHTVQRHCISAQSVRCRPSAAYEFNVDWKAKSSTRNQKQKYLYKEESKKKTKCQCPLSPAQVQDPWRQSKWNPKEGQEPICETDEF